MSDPEAVKVPRQCRDTLSRRGKAVLGISLNILPVEERPALGQHDDVSRVVVGCRGGCSTERILPFL